MDFSLVLVSVAKPEIMIYLEPIHVKFVTFKWPGKIHMKYLGPTCCDCVLNWVTVEYSCGEVEIP